MIALVLILLGGAIYFSFRIALHELGCFLNPIGEGEGENTSTLKRKFIRILDLVMFLFFAFQGWLWVKLFFKVLDDVLL